MVGHSSNQIPPGQLLEFIPHKWPMRFVKEIHEASDQYVRSSVYFDASLPFYEGHFPTYPVTPGVLLTEAMAQAGILPMGIILYWQENQEQKTPAFVLTSDHVDYFLPVPPGSVLQVEAWQSYFRFGKLKGRVEMKNEAGDLVARGTIAGMLGNQEKKA